MIKDTRRVAEHSAIEQTVQVDEPNKFTAHSLGKSTTSFDLSYFKWKISTD